MIIARAKHYSLGDYLVLSDHNGRYVGVICDVGFIVRASPKRKYIRASRNGVYRREKSEFAWVYYNSCLVGGELC